MNGNIRKANAQDYQQVERLMQQVHILHANWRPDIYKHCSVVLSEERFLEHIKNEEIVVLEKENSVIGVMIYLTRNISGGLMQDRKILFIDALAVDEKERGNGFGITGKCQKPHRYGIVYQIWLYSEKYQYGITVKRLLH